MERLFVRIAAPAQPVDGGWTLDSLSWVVLDEAGQVFNQGTGDLDALTGLIDENIRSDPDNVVVIIPGEYCLSLQATVPGRATGQIRRALPFVVEEYLASDIDRVHLAHGPIRRGSPIDCIAVDIELLDGWRSALTAAGITPGTLLADADMLPVAVDEVTLFFDEARTLIRTPQQSLVAEDDTLALVLTGAMEQLPPEQLLRVRCINGRLSALDQAQLDQAAPMSLEWLHEDAESAGFIALARGWQTQGTGINLLQGAYTPPRQRHPAWQHWRGVAAMVGIWFVVALAAQSAQAIWADHQAAQLDREIRARYQAYFPEDARRATTAPLATLRGQMAQRIGDSSGVSGFLALTEQLAAGLAELNGANGSGTVNTELRSLTYHEARMELGVDLSARDFAALDRLRDRLSETGLSVEISSAEQQDNGVRARFRLRG